MSDEPTQSWQQAPIGQPGPTPTGAAGAWQASPQPGAAPRSPQPTPAPGAGSPPSQPSGVAKYLVGAAGALLVVGVLVGAYLLGRSGGDEPAPTSSTSTAPTTAPETTTSVPTPPATTAPAPAASAPPTPGNVLTEPAGLFCRDLRGRGYSYSAAVAYWENHGHTDQMDADKNGIPCETVYPRSDVESYWPAATYEDVPSYMLPSGLLCRDLQARGIGVYDALRYYIWEGFPSRMDADGNGIPCETVYSNATVVWLTEF